jgi:AraC-like DNA-binding protein
MTPRRYITQVRINAACVLLSETDETIAEVASRTGFYDQSHFTHQFTRHKGTSPRQYRERFRGHAFTRQMNERYAKEG